MEPVISLSAFIYNKNMRRLTSCYKRGHLDRAFKARRGGFPQSFIVESHVTNTRVRFFFTDFDAVLNTSRYVPEGASHPTVTDLLLLH